MGALTSTSEQEGARGVEGNVVQLPRVLGERVEEGAVNPVPHACTAVHAARREESALRIPRERRDVALVLSRLALPRRGRGVAEDCARRLAAHARLRHAPEAGGGVSPPRRKDAGPWVPRHGENF